MLLDSSRALREAQRFRARVIAATLAESAAELASANMVNQYSAHVNAEDDQGTMTGNLQRTGTQFMITANSEATGVPPQKADVRVQGRINGTQIIVDYTFHSQ